ncbi:hypothetical protein QJQ45_007031 [Haematococcus lacustris]|nr:hypothetical protein QJQ45_007031 [Haematococcus lacustris]
MLARQGQPMQAFQPQAQQAVPTQLQPAQLFPMLQAPQTRTQASPTLALQGQPGTLALQALQPQAQQAVLHLFQAPQMYCRHMRTEAAADALHAAAAAATPTASAAAASARALPVDVDERAHAFICSTVNVRKYRGLCERHTTARGLWEALRDMHVSKVLASRSLLVRQAASLRMSEEESVQDYWARAEDLHEQLNLTEPYGETLTQALEGLPAGFDIVVNEVLRKPVASVAFQGLAVSNAMSVVSKPLLRGEWLVDSGCSRHLTPHRDILQGYEPLPVPHTIICGNGSTMAATGQGSVQFRGAGGELTLLNVLHVPAAEGSLVSVGKATRAGGVVHFTPHGCCINMPGTACSITARQIEEDLFLLDSQPVHAADSYRMAAGACDPMILHHRLGHPGYRQLARPTGEGKVKGSSVKAAHCEATANSGNLCEPCVLAKQHQFVAVKHQGLGGAVKHASKSVVEQAVLHRYAPAPVSGPAALAAPPEGEASRGGVGTEGAAGDSLGSRGGTPAVTPTVTPASSSSVSSRECGGQAGGGGQAGSGGVPPAALRGSPGWDGEGGDGAGLGGAGVIGLGGDGAGGMERTPESLAAPAPEQASPLLRRGERVRKAVRFADYVTVCYSARNVSCNSSEGVRSSGSSGRRERVALVGSRAAAIGFSTKRRFSKAVSRPEAEEWGRAVDAKMARVQLLPAAASLWHEAGDGGDDGSAHFMHSLVYCGVAPAHVGGYNPHCSTGGKIPERECQALTSTELSSPDAGFELRLEPVECASPHPEQPDILIVIDETLAVDVICHEHCAVGWQGPGPDSPTPSALGDELMRRIILPHWWAPLHKYSHDHEVFVFATSSVIISNFIFAQTLPILILIL